MPRTKFHPSGDSNKKSPGTEKSSKKLPTKPKVAPEQLEQSPALMAEIMDTLELSPAAKVDGSYKRQQKRQQETTEHIAKNEETLLAKLAEMLETYNNKLEREFGKGGRSPSLSRAGNGKGNTIKIRVVAPLKPGDVDKSGTGTKQYDLSLYGKNPVYSEDGIKLAYQEALRLAYQLNDPNREFVWDDKFLGKKKPNGLESNTETEQPKTIGELIDSGEFEKKYFLKRKRDRQSEDTFNIYIGFLNRFASKDVPLSTQAIMDAIEKTESGTSNRFNLVKTLGVFCKSFDFKFDFGGYANGYKSKPRNIPKDEQIIECFNLFKTTKHKSSYQWQAYQQVYGYLATYGLRPHEYFAIDWDKTLATDNDRNLVYIDEVQTEGTKTGNRVVFPLHPEWVELFDLKNRKPLETDAGFKCRTLLINKDFRRNKLPFTPYDLRHAYAIRGNTVGLSVKDMSENMGHTAQKHANTYQKWITLENRETTYDAALARYQARLAEKTEIERLREQLVTMESKLAQSDRVNSQLLADNLKLHEQLGNSLRVPDIEALKAEVETLRAENQRVQRDFIELAAKAEQVEMQLLAEREYRVMSSNVKQIVY